MRTHEGDVSSKAKPWLITGGCGYIGGHILKELHSEKVSAEYLDIEYSPEKHRLFSDYKYHACDVKDKDSLREIFLQQEFEGVIHLAALKSVSNSQEQKQEYFETNVIGTRNILELMTEFKIQKIVFSSTAAVYQVDPNNHFVSELSPIGATSYYGETKILAENLIAQASKEDKIQFLIFRYFNVAGATDKSLSDYSKVNLIPAVLSKLLTNESPEIYGSDYDTLDGTAIRDFVDIRDVVMAHICAIEYMKSNSDSQILNIGTGEGASVKQVIKLAQEILGTTLFPVLKERRSGDIAKITANCAKAQKIIGFEAQFTLRDMIESSIP